jgi:hypothetical protein
VVRPRVVAVVARHRFRFDNQNFAICRILSTHCTNRDRKKRNKKGGIRKAHHKIILILVFYLRTYHPFRCYRSRLQFRLDRFSPSTLKTRLNSRTDESRLCDPTTASSTPVVPACRPKAAAEPELRLWKTRALLRTSGAGHNRFGLVPSRPLL